MTPNYLNSTERVYGCRFLKKKGNKHICEITDRLFNDKISVNIGAELIRNPSGKLLQITQKQHDYWLNQCRPYPDSSDPGHCPPRHFLIVGCGFRLTKVED